MIRHNKSSFLSNAQNRLTFGFVVTGLGIGLIASAYAHVKS